MKKILIVGVILFLVTSVFSFYFVAKSEKQNIASPLPEELNSSKNSQVSSLDFWLPTVFGFFNLDSEVPLLTAKSALIYDLKNDKAIYEKNTEKKVPMASITKLMTAMVAIDNKKPDDRYIVREASLVGENVMGLSAGEVMSLEELLLGVFMYSANDAAEVLADNSLGREKFIQTMNDKAKAIGLNNTNFTNPTGLQGDGNQYSTAEDLLILSRHAIENYPGIVKAAGTWEEHLPESEDHYEYYLYTQLNLLTTYPGVKGLKDGYTPEAGWCLITYYEDQDQELIGVILGSEDRRNEMKVLLDYSLIELGVDPPQI